MSRILSRRAVAKALAPSTDLPPSEWLSRAAVLAGVSRDSIPEDAPVDYTAVVHGDPKAQPRTRAFVRGGKIGVYNPATAEGWKAAIAIALRDLAGKKILGPLCLDAVFVFRRPANHYRANGTLKPSAPAWHTQKPDRDNLDKAVLDTITQIGGWGDDCQIVDGRIRKIWEDQDHKPGLILHLTRP